MKPPTSARNLTPTSTEFVSLPLVLAGLALLGKMLHGQVPGGEVGSGVVVGLGVRVGVDVAAADGPSTTATTAESDGMNRALAPKLGAAKCVGARGKAR